MLGKIAPGIVDHAFGVDQPDPLTSFLLGQAMEGKEAHQLHRDTDSRRTSAEE